MFACIVQVTALRIHQIPYERSGSDPLSKREARLLSLSNNPILLYAHQPKRMFAHIVPSDDSASL